MGAYHLTALNVSEYEGHRVAASKSADLPVHLMESVGLLPETRGAIASMYERYDGQGIPNGQAGKDIPLGARILSVADTYADLTQNPRNPYRKILRPFEACEVLVQYRGTVFDPNIVDIFRQSTTGEDMRAKLLSDRHEALIVDPDPEETTVLELRLIEQGFEVKIARTVAQARKILAENEISAVVSEIDLDTPDAGIALREQLINEGKGRDITWVVLTGKTDRQSAQRAFDLGVDDFVLKPASTDIFAAKLRQLIERRLASSGGGAARGVSGSLTEMSLPDMIRILWHGRKTCALRISAGSSSGEIDFSEGQVVDARWDSLRGEDAFYKMLTLREGDFRLDPTFKPTTRIDPGLAGGAPPRRDAPPRRGLGLSGRGAMDVPVIETERLLLTLGAPETAGRYVAFACDNEEHLARWEPPRPEGYFSEAYWYRRLERNRDELARDLSFRLGIFRRNDPEGPVLGHVNFSQIVRGAAQSCSLGYSLDRRCVGRGMMTEALAGAIPLRLRAARAAPHPGQLHPHQRAQRPRAAPARLRGRGLRPRLPLHRRRVARPHPHLADQPQRASPYVTSGMTSDVGCQACAPLCHGGEPLTCAKLRIRARPCPARDMLCGSGRD